MKLSTVIFDLNGTVLSDEYNYGYAFKRVLLKMGAKVDTDYPHTGGVGVAENWPGLIRKYKVKTNKSADQLAIETQQEYLAQINEFELNQGFLEFAKELKKSNINIALATSNTWDVVERILEKFDLEDFFDVITTKEEVDRNKPDPRIFLLTAEKLMVEPEMCLVFEDSSSGIKAAKSAGMKTIGVARDNDQIKALKNADKVVEDFLEVTPQILEEFN